MNRGGICRIFGQERISPIEGTHGTLKAHTGAFTGRVRISSRNINAQGRVMIKPQFTKANKFSEGLAVVAVAWDAVATATLRGLSDLPKELTEG